MESAKRAKIEFGIASTSYSFSKLPKKIEQTGEIFRLNDDCFESILYWLSADDLSAFSGTCVRIQNLVKVYFARMYVHKRTEIERLNGIVAVKRYAALRDVIRNISFRGNPKPRQSWWEETWENSHVNDLLAYYVRSGCNQQPKFLRFEHMILNKAEGDLIKNALHTVEIVEILNCDLHEFYSSILRHCRNIKELTVRSCKFLYELEPWLLQKYPTLERLDIHLDGLSDHEVLKTFFVNNPQIKKFACRSRLCSYLSKIENLMLAIAPLKLEELHLTIGGECDFHSIYAQLFDISKQSQFKRLSLEFGSADVKDIFIDNLNNLACLDTLYALHITNVDFAKDLPTNIDSLTNLKELHLNNLANCDYSAKMLSTVTPNLEVLIVRNSCYFTPSVVDFIQPFIELLPKLKKIILVHDVWPRVNQRLAYLNERRQQLQGACKLKIWLQPFNFKLREKPTTTNLIKILPLYDEYEHF